MLCCLVVLIPNPLLLIVFTQISPLFYYHDPASQHASLVTNVIGYWSYIFLPCLTLLSQERRIQGQQRFHRRLTRPSNQKGLNSPKWFPDELSETLWDWRTVRRPPVTPCSTSASTWLLVTWMKPSSQSSSSRGRMLMYSHHQCTCQLSMRHAGWHTCWGTHPSVWSTVITSPPVFSTGALVQRQSTQW